MPTSTSVYKVGNPQERHASNQVALYYRTHGNRTRSSGQNPCSLHMSQNNDLQEWDVSVSHSSGYDLMVFEAHSALRGTVNNKHRYISTHTTKSGGHLYMQVIYH